MVRTLTATTVGVALGVGLSGCGAEAPEGPLAGGSGSPSADASAPASSGAPSSDEPSGAASSPPTDGSAGSLPPFALPGKNQPMHLTEPPAPANTKAGAIAFAVYRASITADGFEPPVADLLRSTSTAQCEGCGVQVTYVKGVNDKGQKIVGTGSSMYHGVVDVVKDKADSWQVVLEYSVPAGRLVDASGTTVQAYKPEPFALTATAMTWKDGRFLVTRTSTDFPDGTQIGGRR